jgi:hypothetical protein
MEQDNAPVSEAAALPGGRLDGSDDGSLEDDVPLEDSPGPENVDNNQGGDEGISPSATTRAAPRRKDPPGPSMKSDYRAWINARKPLWREHRLKMKNSSGRLDGAATLAGLGGGMQKQLAAVMHATWHILQVRRPAPPPAPPHSRYSIPIVPMDETIRDT